jgi:hypothetical protein
MIETLENKGKMNKVHQLGEYMPRKMRLVKVKSRRKLTSIAE